MVEGAKVEIPIWVGIPAPPSRTDKYGTSTKIAEDNEYVMSILIMKEKCRLPYDFMKSCSNGDLERIRTERALPNNLKSAKEVFLGNYDTEDVIYIYR